jgi:DnaK suppressor protein
MLEKEETGGTPMTPPVNMNDLREYLTTRREQILHELHAVQRTLNSSGESHPADYAEHAADVFDQDLTICMTDRRSRELAAVERALENMEGQCYGQCAKCNGHISAARLRVMPTATLCITCQEALEEKQTKRTRLASPVWGNFTEIPYELAFEN